MADCVKNDLWYLPGGSEYNLMREQLFVTAVSWNKCATSIVTEDIVCGYWTSLFDEMENIIAIDLDLNAI